MSVFPTPNRWCDGILRGTGILLRMAFAVICLLYTRGGRRNYIPGFLSGEPAVPGIIPGGVASCPIPGRSGSDP